MRLIARDHLADSQRAEGGGQVGLGCVLVTQSAQEAGADPVLVTSWINETQAKRAAAQARLRKPAERRRMTREAITSLVTALRDVMQVLQDADPADKAEVYSRLGLTLTYHPEDKRVIAEARPETIMYVGKCPRGDLIPIVVVHPKRGIYRQSK